MKHDRVRQPLRKVNKEPVEPVYRLLAHVLGGVLRLLVRQDWGPADLLPKSGGVIIVANHISLFDPPNLAHFLIWSGRWPRFFVTTNLWPIFGWLTSIIGQIPVDPDTPRSADALRRAGEVLQAGGCVVIYPEGGITRDPDLWPMTARTGAARLALQCGCPVIPVGQWGAQDVMPSPGVSWPRFSPRKSVHVRLGAPIDLTDLVESPAAVPLAGARIMDAITELVAELRCTTSPTDRYDNRVGHRVPVLRP